MSLSHTIACVRWRFSQPPPHLTGGASAHLSSAATFAPLSRPQHPTASQHCEMCEIVHRATAANLTNARYNAVSRLYNEVFH